MSVILLWSVTVYALNFSQQVLTCVHLFFLVFVISFINIKYPDTPTGCCDRMNPLLLNVLKK